MKTDFVITVPGQDTAHDDWKLPSAEKLPFWHPDTNVPRADQLHCSETVPVVYQWSHWSLVEGVSHLGVTDS
jgi:hypothetical protein